MAELTVEERLTRLEEFLPILCDKPSLAPTESPDKVLRTQFGRRIRIARKVRGLTQKDLATKLGVVAVSISNYENGIIEPSLKNLLNLSRILGVTSDYLIGNAPPPQSIGSD